MFWVGSGICKLIGLLRWKLVDDILFSVDQILILIPLFNTHLLFNNRRICDSTVTTCVNGVRACSAQAQQLTAPITSASKLQSQRHQLYLLKDGESNGYISHPSLSLQSLYTNTHFPLFLSRLTELVIFSWLYSAHQQSH